VNILAFLSTSIFFSSVSSEKSDPCAPPTQSAARQALWMSFGFGFANFIFTFLAFGRIDQWVGQTECCSWT